MNIKKKLILIAALFSLTICIGSTSYTYAKYATKTSRDLESKISRWNVKINNEDISKITTDENGKIIVESKKTLDNKLEINFIDTSNENIEKNVIVPGTQGNFEVNLDFTDVDVSFKYEIEFDFSEANLDGFQVVDYEVDGVKTIPTNNLIEKTVYKTDTDRKDDLKINIEWVDENTEESNKINTALAGQDIKINIYIKLVQIQEP